MIGAGRLDNIKESVIREMTREAKKHDAINLSQGYPDYPTSTKLIDEAEKAMREGKNQYSITWGREKLRKAVSKKLRSFNGLQYDPTSEITITCGSSEAVMSTILGLVNESEEVLVFEPFYENYVPAIQMASGKPVFTEISKQLTIDKEDIKEKVSSETKIILLNTPHNPTGKVFGKDELKFIRDVCIQNDIILVTDEIYERMIYEGEHISPGSFEDMRERTVNIGGFSKIYSVTGWRVGYVAAPNKFMKPIRKVHDYTTVCAPTPFQEGAARALNLDDEYYEDMLDYYRKGRKIVLEGLQETEMVPVKPEGAYYMLASIENYDMNDKEFVKWLVRDKGVAVVPGSSFYSEGGEDLVRFCFSQEIDLLKEAMDRLKE